MERFGQLDEVQWGIWKVFQVVLVTAIQVLQQIKSPLLEKTSVDIMVVGVDELMKVIFAVLQLIVELFDTLVDHQILDPLQTMYILRNVRIKRMDRTG